MTARLSDADFFYQEDLKRPLLSRIVQLDKIIFQEKLGSLGDKVQRIVKLSENIAKQCGPLNFISYLCWNTKISFDLPEICVLSTILQNFPENQPNIADISEFQYY